MIRNIILFFTFILCQNILAQNESPYAIFGDNSQMLNVPNIPNVSLSTQAISENGDTCIISFHFKEQFICIYNSKEKSSIQYHIDETTKARFLSVDPNAEDYCSISPYTYCMNNPISLIDPDGRSVYMLLYTVGNGTNDDNMFKMAAETRMRDIMKSKGFDASKDIVVMKSITDLGTISETVNSIVSCYSKQYGNTIEFDLWSHSGLDGPIGTVPTSNYPLETLQMNMQGWESIDFNWANNASAYFYGCRTGASSTEYSSFTTNLSALKNFHNINIYGQSSFSYPSVYTNRRETTLDILQGNFSYPTYMVGGTKGDGINAFFIGTPAPSMRKSYNGRGHLKNYFQSGRRY